MSEAWTRHPVTSTRGFSLRGPHSTRSPRPPSPAPRPLCGGRRREREAESPRQREEGRESDTLTQPTGGVDRDRDKSKSNLHHKIITYTIRVYSCRLTFYWCLYWEWAEAGTATPGCGPDDGCGLGPALQGQSARVWGSFGETAAERSPSRGGARRRRRPRPPGQWLSGREVCPVYGNSGTRSSALYNISHTETHETSIYIVHTLDLHCSQLSISLTLSSADTPPPPPPPPSPTSHTLTTSTRSSPVTVATQLPLAFHEVQLM